MRTIVAPVLVVAAAACHSTPVYDVSSSDENSGIPFYPIVPARRESTQYEQRWDRIEITMASTGSVEEGGKKASRESTATWVFNVDEHDPRCKSTRDTRPLVSALASGDQAAIVAAINAIATPCLSDPKAPVSGVASQNDLDNAREKELLVQTSKQRTIEMIPATIPRYVNVVTPYGGTASAEVAVSDRGLLTSAKATVTDAYPAALTESLVGLVESTMTTFTGLGTALATLNSNKSDPPPPASVKAQTIKVTISVKPRRRVYTWTESWAPTPLGQALDLSGACKPELGCHQGLTVVVEDADLAKAPAPASVPAAAAPKESPK